MISAIKLRWDSHFGGILLVCVIAAAATFLSEHYGAPAMLFALLIGMAFHFLNADPVFSPGLELSAKTLLRVLYERSARREKRKIAESALGRDTTVGKKLTMEDVDALLATPTSGAAAWDEV